VNRLTVYTYAKCSTCRAAIAWLVAHRIPHVEKAMRETPPSLSELRAMLAGQGGVLRRLCNTSGLDYRAQGLAQKLPTMTEAEVLRLLAGNGMLIKRPFLLGPGVALTGFKEPAWKQALLPP